MRVALVAAFVLLASCGRSGSTPSTTAPPSTPIEVEMTTNFTTKVNGPVPTTADTGEVFSLADDGVPGSALDISNGEMTNSSTAATVSAGYCQCTMPDDLNQVGGSFTFTPGTATGAATIIIWKSSAYVEGQPVSDSPCHFVITPVRWEYGVWTGGAYTIIATAPFATPLSQDGATVYTCQISISGPTASIQLPDGESTTVTNAVISANSGSISCHEIYQNNASIETKAAFTKIWAGYPQPLSSQ
jgi:hypothetical protein